MIRLFVCLFISLCSTVGASGVVDNPFTLVGGGGIGGSDLQFDTPPSLIEWRSDGYNAVYNTTRTKTFSFSYSNNTLGSINAFVQANLGLHSAQQGSGETFPRAAKHTTQNDYVFYQLYTTTDTNSLSDTHVWLNTAIDTHGSQIFQSALSAGASQSSSFLMTVAANQYVPAGTYEDTVQIDLYTGLTFVPFGQVLQETISATVRIEVIPYVYVDLLPQDPFVVNAELDFGNMVANATRSLDFQVRSNADVTVTFDSANNGQLRNPNLPGSVTYTMTRNIFSPYNLNTDTPQVINLSFLFAETQTQHLQFKLPSTIPFIAAGEYSDTITIEVETP